MALFLSAYVSVPDHVLVSQVGDELVLLNLNSERYFGLDDVGAQMWKAVAAGSTLRAAYDRLAGEYQVEPETLERDLLKWAADLVEHGLLEHGLLEQVNGQVEPVTANLHP